MNLQLSRCRAVVAVLAATLLASCGGRSAASPTSALAAFPIIGAEAAPLGKASYLPMPTGPVGVAMFAARRDGDTLVDSVAIGAWDKAPEFTQAPVVVTIHGVPATMYKGGGTPAWTAVVLPGNPTVTVSGNDPVGFLQLAGPTAIAARSLTEPTQGHPGFTLDLNPLPDGYEIIVAPQEWSVGGSGAAINLESTTTSPEMYVDVVPFNPLVAGEIVDPVQIVDVNGKVAWLTTRENISLTWEGAPGIFVVMGGGEDGERLLSVAREVRLVDEQTWQAAYHVEPGAVAVSTG